MPDPDAPPLSGRDRRRTVRQRLHTPVYVSFNTAQSGAVLDLSELLDLHEQGFAVQTAIPTTMSTSDRLEVNRAVTLCLDLPETRKYVHGSGQVMWTDDTGRVGIRFSFLPDVSRQALKEWLFSNLLVASTNHSARIRQLEQHRQESRASEWVGAQAGMAAPLPFGQRTVAPNASELSVQESGHLARKLTAPENIEPHPVAPHPVEIDGLGDVPVREPESPATPEPSLSAGETADATPDTTEVLSALDDVRRQIRQMQDSESEAANHYSALDSGHSAAILQLIVERAATLTGASGAALALLTGDSFVCRASIGIPAPPVGSAVNASAGLSGECLRTGAIVSCRDTESDLRVDPEICRMAGIGSFMAAPIFADFRVVGLIEVFSPYPYTFAETHKTVLERLAELVPREDKGSTNNKETGGRQIGSQTAQPETAAVRAERIEEIERQDVEPAIANQSNAVEEVTYEGVTAEEIAEEEASAQNLSDFAEPVRPAARRFPFSQLVLMVMTIAVAAMTLGYLLAPTIEQHWLRPAQAAESAPHPPIAVDRRGHSLSPDDLRKLAEQGDPDAQWQLGILYHEGDGVPKDDAMAVQWYERAAEQGYVRAQATLGAYYWAGHGVQPDVSKAYFWSQLAVAQGDKDSRARLEGLSAQMTQAQVAAARQQAEAWLRAHNQTANSKPTK
jgi:hypothetical protein